MSTENLLKGGRAINIILILVNVGTFIFYTAERIRIRGGNYGMNDLIKMMTAENAVRIISGVIAGLCLIGCIVLWTRNEGRLKGWGLILAASIVTIVFSITGFMIGIVIWILCGIANTQLKNSSMDFSERENYFGTPVNPYGGSPYGGNTYGGSPYGGSPYNGQNADGPVNSSPYAQYENQGMNGFNGGAQGFNNAQGYNPQQSFNNAQGYGAQDFNAQNGSDDFLNN